MTPTPEDGSIPAASLRKLGTISLNMIGAPFGVQLQYVGDAPGLVEGHGQIIPCYLVSYQPGPQDVGLSVGNAGVPVGLNVTVFVQ